MAWQVPAVRPMARQKSGGPVTSRRSIRMSLERVDAINDAFGPILGQLGLKVLLLSKGAESGQIGLVDVETFGLEQLYQFGLTGDVRLLAEVDGSRSGSVKFGLLIRG